MSSWIRHSVARLRGRHWLGPALVAAVLLILLSAAAGAALESDAVGSYWRGLWWATALVTTVGFIGPTPTTVPGALLSVLLMVSGFLLLSLVSAALASLFVREDEAPSDARVRADIERLEAKLDLIAARLEQFERGSRAEQDGPDS